MSPLNGRSFLNASCGAQQNNFCPAPKKLVRTVHALLPVLPCLPLRPAFRDLLHAPLPAQQAGGTLDPKLLGTQIRQLHFVYLLLYYPCVFAHLSANLM